MTTSIAPARYILPHEAKVEFKHLFRALLRSAGYLPDPFARTYWRELIVERFRPYYPRPRNVGVKAEFSFGTSTKWVKDEKSAKGLRKTCRNELNRLRDAGNGHTEALEKVIGEAYGRRGPRRHRLLRSLLAQETQTDGDAVAELIKSEKEGAPGKEEKHGSKLSAAVMALATVQKKQPADNIRAGKIKRLNPHFEETNAWARPMPAKRLRNMWKKFDDSILTKLLPPLPREEWERLRDLASGTMKWDGGVPKRHAAVEARSDVLAAPIEVPPASRRGFHQISQRSMRRLWRLLFLQSPVMERVPATGKWKVEWGKVEGAIPSARGERHGFLFAYAADEYVSKGWAHEHNKQLIQKNKAMRGGDELKGKEALAGQETGRLTRLDSDLRDGSVSQVASDRIIRQVADSTKQGEEDTQPEQSEPTTSRAQEHEKRVSRVPRSKEQQQEDVEFERAMRELELAS